MATIFSNSRFMETVDNETAVVKLHGEVTYDSNKLVTNFNGSITSVDGGKYGSFNYSETSDGNVSRSYNGPKDIETDACALIDSTVLDIKNRKA